MLYVGLVLGIFAQHYAANGSDLNAGRTTIATLILLMPALAGARLLFVISHWNHFRRNPQRIWRRSDGGAAMYGGLLAAFPLSIPLLAAFWIPLGAFWDVASFTMLIGMIVARAGCLLNGCCCGRPTSGRLGWHLPDHRGVWTRRIPTQILEATWGLAVLAGAIAIWEVLPFSGALFLYTLAAYGAGRIVLESTRQEQDCILGLGLQRTISTAFVGLSLTVFALACLR
jgi:phosphatidylglycerol:prolipoprotein diacylglycerol transferase